MPLKKYRKNATKYDRQIKNAKPTEKPYKLTDGHGLHLLIKPNGGKYWRLDYAIDRKRKTLAIGVYPLISLVEAREAAENARRDLAAGIDPSAAKQQAKQERQAALLNTFESVAKQWHSKNLPRWKEQHAASIMKYFESDVFPHIGSRPIKELRVSDIKNVIERIAERGALETAEKIRQWIEYLQLCRLAGAELQPSAPLVGYLPKRDGERSVLTRECLSERFFQTGILYTDFNISNLY